MYVESDFDIILLNPLSRNLNTFVNLISSLLRFCLKIIGTQIVIWSSFLKKINLNKDDKDFKKFNSLILANLIKRYFLLAFFFISFIKF